MIVLVIGGNTRSHMLAAIMAINVSTNNIVEPTSAQHSRKLALDGKDDSLSEIGGIDRLCMVPPCEAIYRHKAEGVREVDFRPLRDASRSHPTTMRELRSRERRRKGRK
jgi:hypothetical protein